MDPLRERDSGVEGQRGRGLDICLVGFIVHLSAVTRDGNRKQRLEKVVEERKKQYETLLVENAKLREEAEAARHESFDVTEYLRSEILGKDERISELQLLLDEVSLLLETVKMIDRPVNDQ